MITYKEIYDKVVGSGKYHSRMDKVSAIAQLTFSHKFRGCETKRDAAWLALELLEDMTGVFYDPTPSEFEDVLASIIG